jgi:hypothetical protein
MNDDQEIPSNYRWAEFKFPETQELLSSHFRKYKIKKCPETLLLTIEVNENLTSDIIQELKRLCMPRSIKIDNEYPFLRSNFLK